MADWSFVRDYQYAPKSRQRVRLNLTANTPGDRQYPRNYQFRGGQYYEVFVEAGDLHVRRSHGATPPFAWETVIVDGSAITYPWFHMHPRGTGLLLYQKGAADIYLARTFDEALSFEAATLAIAGGSKAFGAVNPFDGSEVIAAFIAATEKIQIQTRAAGELNFGTPFTFQDEAFADVLFEDDTFAMHWGFVTFNPLVAHVHVKGEASTSTWRCYNMGDTVVTPNWKRE